MKLSFKNGMFLNTTEILGAGRWSGPICEIATGVVDTWMFLDVPPPTFPDQLASMLISCIVKFPEFNTSNLAANGSAGSLEIEGETTTLEKKVGVPAAMP